MAQVNKYNSSKIYKISSNLTDKIYVGSTTQTLSQRLSDHVSQYKRYVRINDRYITSYEIIKLGDYYITLIEENNFNNKQQLFKREGEVIKLNINNVVNKIIAGRTKAEYYIEHIDDKKAYDIYYRLNNIEHKKELDRNYCKLKHTCDCGLVLAFKHLKQHLERSIHPKLIQQLFNNELNHYNF